MQIQLKKQHRRYSKYKKTALLEILEVPEYWEVRKLKYNATISNGKEYKDIDIEDKNYPVFGSGGEFGRTDTFLYNKPSVLLGRKGTIDKPLYVEEPFWTVDTMFYTRIFRNTFPKFFYYQCLTIDFDKYQYGSALPSMTQGTLSNIYFCTPEREEQEKIAQYLDKKTQLVDQTIQSKQKQIELLKERRMSLINQAVTRGIDENVEMKESGVQWIGEIPKNWEVKKLKHCSSVQFSSIDKHIFDDERKVSVCNYTDVYYGDIISDNDDFIEGSCTVSEYQKYKIKKGDVIITKDSESPDDIAIPAFIAKNFENTVCGYHLCLIRSFPEQIDGSFLFRYFQSLGTRKYFEINANGITRFGLGKSKVKNLFIPIPPIKEQQKIITFLNSETQKIDQTISLIEQSITLLKEYKTSLITHITMGKIDIINS